MTKQYDVLFLGSGHAAWHAALTLSKAGKSVAMIEKDRIAGTCTNYGCNAKIVLEYPFEILEQASHYPNMINTTRLKVDWDTLMQHKHRVIDPLAGHLQHLFEQNGIDIIRGSGQLVDEHTIQVDHTLYYGAHIVIATGQRSHQLNIKGQALTHDSRDFLSLSHMPKHITFLGIGIISIEFASIAIKSGAEVHMIHHNDRPVKGFYHKHVTKLIEKLANEGVHFHMNESTQSITQHGQSYTVTTASGLNLQTHYVLDATGRTPNVASIGLDTVGIAYSKKGIQVDEYMRTSVPHIYASGDVVDKTIPKLTPTATFESNYIASHILNPDQQPITYPAVPSVLYTLPRLANIGVSIEEAIQNDKYRVVDIPFGQRMAFEYKNETDAQMTIALDEANHLVGAAIYADDAADLINILVFIINQKLQAQDLNQMIFAFPGASSGVIDLLKEAMMTESL
ncbi:dihydrolipoyl dehydrogenase family protein [Staphylococcus felis]|uniref:dihydrolipoyl dehydrogenase family protein n=1 Tax=Staphylococcus felis TaxID=46127 RepID=UPI003967AEE1